MSAIGRKMTARQNRSIHCWPCDGVPRFQVKEYPKASVPYSLAYQSIFHETGCTVDAEGKQTFTREGVRRITILNERYTKTAHRFISSTVQRELAARLTVRADALSAPETKPEPDTTPDAMVQERAPADPVPGGELHVHRP